MKTRFEPVDWAIWVLFEIGVASPDGVGFWDPAAILAAAAAVSFAAAGDSGVD